METKEITQKILIEELKKGNEEAFEVVFNNYKNRVYFIGMQFFKNTEKAEDVVQETFITVYKSINQLNTPEALTVWIQKIAYQKCLKISQSDKKKYVNLSDEITIEDFEDENKENNIEKIVNQRELFKIVNDEIQKMNPEFKEVAYFRFFDDLSIKEIAEIVGVPEGTIKSRLSKIRSILKKSLSKRGINISLFTSFVMFPGVIELYKEFQNLYTLDSETSLPIIDKVINIGNNVNSTAAPIVAETTTLFTSFVKSDLATKLITGISVIGLVTVTGEPLIDMFIKGDDKQQEVITKPKWGTEKIEDRIVKIPFYDEKNPIDFSSIRCDNCDFSVQQFTDYSGELSVSLEKGEKTTVYVSNTVGHSTYVIIESIITE